MAVVRVSAQEGTLETKANITVRMVSGSSCEISPCDHWTFHDLQVEIERKLGVCVSQQRLFHGSRRLEEAMHSGTTGTCHKLLQLQRGQDTRRELLMLVRSAEAASMIERVRQDGRALDDASEELKADREVVMEAVKQDGCALEYASEELKADKQVVIEAVKRNGYALVYASEELKADKEVVIEAVKQHELSGGAL